MKMKSNSIPQIADNPLLSRDLPSHEVSTAFQCALSWFILFGVQINNTLQQVLGLLQSQQQEMKQMRQDIIKSQQANSIIQSMRSRIDRLDKTVCTKIESTMAKQSEQERILLK